jgi:hypothetical protein
MNDTRGPEVFDPAVNCVHHWKLDRPVGEITHGCCKNCGEERDFQQVAREGSYYTRGPRAK